MRKASIFLGRAEAAVSSERSQIGRSSRRVGSRAPRSSSEARRQPAFVEDGPERRLAGDQVATSTGRKGSREARRTPAEPGGGRTVLRYAPRASVRRASPCLAGQGGPTRRQIARSASGGRAGNARSASRPQRDINACIPAAPDSRYAEDHGPCGRRSHPGTRNKAP